MNLPTELPYLIDNINFGDRFVTINYSDPAQQGAGILHFDQLVFPPDVAAEELAELSDLVCEVIDKVQTMRRGPAERVVPRTAAAG